MDNNDRTDHWGCTGGWGGYCYNDLKVYFRNKVGEGCTTNWLFNQARVQRGQHGSNGNDAFDSEGWDCFSWSQVNCVSGNGLHVPNKVFIPNDTYLFSVL